MYKNPIINPGIAIDLSVSNIILIVGRSSEAQIIAPSPMPTNNVKKGISIKPSFISSLNSEFCNYVAILILIFIIPNNTT
jgi:hypothetical protein